MKILLYISCAVGLWAVTALTHAESHPEVLAALDYQIEPHTCGERPSLRRGAEYANDTHETVMSDVDHYTRTQHNRKLKKWTRCIKRYNKILLKDFARLKDSVKHGMTQDQANTVLGKLKAIQDTVMEHSKSPS
ncbi:MAG: hypothetical protein AAF541_17580 [Pseudomonadota bacterium]